MRIKIRTTGTGRTEVVNADTGEPIEGVLSVMFAADTYDPEGKVTLHFDAAFVEKDLHVTSVEITNEVVE